MDIVNDPGDESEPPSFLLHVKYPENYPDVPPVLELSAPRNAPEHPYFDLDDDAAGLLASLEETIEENLGMAMVFTLVSTLKDNAEQLIAGRQEEERNRAEERVLALEREENKKFHGTPVTPETFMAWRKDFRKEMEEAREKGEREDEAAEKKRNRGRETVVALTGKQLFERGMVGKVEEEDDGDDGLEEEVEKLKVDG